MKFLGSFERVRIWRRIIHGKNVLKLVCEAENDQPLQNYVSDCIEKKILRSQKSPDLHEFLFWNLSSLLTNR